MNGRKVTLVKQSSTADRVAIILRERILLTDENTYIGSEGDVAKEVGVSLPTLRQAARMLEYEELLTIKPGKGGGYFSRRPTIETAIKAATQFLSSKDLNQGDMFMDAADAILNQILVAAVKCKDKTLINRLKLFVESQNKYDENSYHSPDYSFKVSTELMTLLAQMSQNILLELFVRTVWSEISVSHTRGTSEENRQIMLANHTSRLSLAKAVLAKDKDKALRAWRKRSKFLRTSPRAGFGLTQQQK